VKNPATVEPAESSNTIKKQSEKASAIQLSKNQSWKEEFLDAENEFGKFPNIPRPKKTKYVPAVLSRKEIDDIIRSFEYPYTHEIRYPRPKEIKSPMISSQENFDPLAPLMIPATGTGEL
jgi:hypothetical protein